MAERTLFPEELTPELREVLGLMLWDTGSIARAWRDTGVPIPRKAEEEQAAVLHRLILLVLEHGPGWRMVAGEWLSGLIDEARRKQQAASPSKAGE